MNYDSIYTSIIQNRKSNPFIGYTELHHILPKCLFPEYNNLKEHSWNGVRLTAREHFICHQILIKLYPNNYGLIHAAHMMSNSKRYGSKKYSWLKEKHIEYSKSLTGDKNHFYGKKHSEETKKKLSLLKQGKLHNRYGKKHSEETKQKMKEKRKLQIITDETRKKLSEWKRTEESKRKMSESHKGKKYSEETKKKLSESKKGENNPMHGKKHSLESIQKMKDAKKKKNN